MLSSLAVRGPAHAVGDTKASVMAAHASRLVQFELHGLDRESKQANKRALTRDTWTFSAGPEPSALLNELE